MNPRSMAALMVLQLLLAGGSESVPAATSVQSQGSSAVVSSLRSGAGSVVEAAVSGRNAVIEVNGDHVELADGRLTLNGTPYGRVDERSTVIYRLEDGERSLRVDGRIRQPMGDRSPAATTGQ
ncbi:hypothetical protein [Halomonas sp. YLGW01]|uniref:hypothetical protein n=1 Tax=Halomonas sp. YLGW01 TaxID=2773308 RepID=UPI001780D233|nr:hypothetical protein [Halomonas sp. YLGW01]